jgi:hypothetical protein
MLLHMSASRPECYDNGTVPDKYAHSPMCAALTEKLFSLVYQVVSHLINSTKSHNFLVLLVILLVLRDSRADAYYSVTNNRAIFPIFLLGHFG